MSACACTCVHTCMHVCMRKYEGSYVHVNSTPHIFCLNSKNMSNFHCSSLSIMSMSIVVVCLNCSVHVFFH